MILPHAFVCDSPQARDYFKFRRLTVITALIRSLYMIKNSLYYSDPYLSQFSAEVLGCDRVKNGYEIVLSQSGFYPEGGEPCDTGTIDGISVERVFERGGRVIHLCPSPVDVGKQVPCETDLERRLRYMRLHTGEHIFTGCLHSLCGANNVGFHMGDDAVTVDFDREVDPQTLLLAEDRANCAVLSDMPVRCFFPSEEELAKKEYRLKKELSGDIRLVEIDGVDCCACCRLHVSHTGEIGMIKVGSYMRYKGGCRIVLYIATDALSDYRVKQREVSAVSALTSAKPHELSKAVGALLVRENALKAELASVKSSYFKLLAENTPSRSGIACRVDERTSAPDLRLLADCLKNVHGRGAAISSDSRGCRFAVADRDGLTKELICHVRSGGVSVKGGGDGYMIQGIAETDAESFRTALIAASKDVRRD